MMDSARRVWQHEIEDISESQLTAVLSELHAVVERLRHDYGEDLFARPFAKGKPTGEDFFVQLKGTENIDQYRVGSGTELNYTVSVANLAQWNTFTIPVILIIWDTTNRAGYWLHMQPFIQAKLRAQPAWLKANGKSKKPSRVVRVPIRQCISNNSDTHLLSLIAKEWRSINQGKNQFELAHTLNTQLRDKTLNPNLSPSIRRQLKIIELEVAAQNDLGNYEPWLELAMAYYDFDNKPEALKAINEAWRLAPADSNVKQARACILAEYAILHRGIPSMLNEAIGLFRSVRSRATAPMANYNIGNSYLGLKDYKNAIKYFDKALAAKPRAKLAAQILTNRGNALDEMGKRDDAVVSFKNAIAQDAKLWNAHSSWAALEVRRGNYKVACRHFRNALRLKPELDGDHQDITYWFAYSLSQIKQFEEALSVLNRLLLDNPPDQRGGELKAYILAHLNRIGKNSTAEALAFFTTRLLDNPADMMARSELNLIYIDQGLDEKRRRLLKETVTFENAPAMALYDYASLLQDDGKVDDAIVYLERAAQLDANHLIVHTLAELKRDQAQYTDAISYYKLAFNGGKESVSILRDIANCYHLLNDYEGSAKVLVLSLLIDSSKIQTWNNLGFTFSKLQSYELFLICAMAMKKIEPHDNHDKKIAQQSLKELLEKIGRLYGKQYVTAIKDIKRQRSLAAL